MNPAKFVILAVLDGWGLASPGEGNAISKAKTPNINRFWISYPHTQLGASGESVGLPRGEAGNTETGHLNLGAGKIVYQDLARINMSIADGSFFENKKFLIAIEHAKKNNSNLHILGLIGAGGVHSNMEHLFALLQLCAKNSFKNVYLHLFTDGRDSPTTAASSYISQIKSVIAREGVGTIASIMGRYWAMDRDNRWDRTSKAYFALTKGEGHLVKSAEEAIQMSYSQGKTDEFIEPSLIANQAGAPMITVKDNDAVIFFNFRIDRPRQLTSAFVLNDLNTTISDLTFDPYTVKYEKRHVALKIVQPTMQTFDRGQKLNNLYFATMTEYSKLIVAAGVAVAFPPEVVTASLGSIIADNNLKQLRMSESEKERFVTFYFNGQLETPFNGEERIIIPSPKVLTYDQKPEMSARQLTDALLARLRTTENYYSFVLVNFANADMVGHTGNIGQATLACEVVDECIGKIANYATSYGGMLLITADHGNAEQMINSHTGEVETEHSSNPVPFIAISKIFLGNGTVLPVGILADVAPTILSFLGISVPTTMLGKNLLQGVTP